MPVLMYSLERNEMIDVTLAILFTVLALLSSFIARFVWTTVSSRFHLHRLSHCPWCWRALHLMRFYPPHWSSTICSYHARQLIAQSHKRRLLRQEILQVKEAKEANSVITFATVQK
jgi:hypothetical protein